MKWTRLAVRIVFPLLGMVLLAAFVWRSRQAGRVASATLAAQPEAKRLDAATGAAGPVRAEGRLGAYPGARVTVGTDLAGTIARVLVHEKDRVRRGQLLAVIESAEQRAELGEARARVTEAEADLRLAAVAMRRWRALRESNLVAEESLDRAVRDRDAAQARVDLARAAAQRHEAIVSKTRIVSPIDGVVIDRAVEPGQAVTEGAAIATVADLSRTRVEAEVDEFDVGAIQLDADVIVTAEGYANRSWRGRVEEIPDAVVGRRLKPQDPGRPADTRVLLVKIALLEPTPLKLGQRVELEIGENGSTP
jgi:multidrug efflux pump subunit AcrA (membrane-fusion protein)